MAVKDLVFGGQESFQASPERLFALLTDLDQMQHIIPDLKSSELVDQHTLKCVVRPGFSFLRGTMNLTISIEESQPHERATMQIAARGIGAQMQIVSRLQIAPQQNGSQLDWQAEVTQLKGLVSTVSPALVRAAADQVIRHAWTQVRRHLGE